MDDTNRHSESVDLPKVDLEDLPKIELKDLPTISLDPFQYVESESSQDPVELFLVAGEAGSGSSYPSEYSTVEEFIETAERLNPGGFATYEYPITDEDS